MNITCKGNQISKYFADFLVKRKGVIDASEYKVEIRSYEKLQNYCDCPDFKKNFLGTCKHIEKIVNFKKPSGNLNSPYIEIFLDYSDDINLKVAFPQKIDPAAKLFMLKYLDANKEFKSPHNDVLQVFMRDMESGADPSIFNYIRISDAVAELNRENIIKENINRIQTSHKESIRQNALSGKFLKFPVYDYQIDGMLHLAFSGRAMLADEMGLGKTVQAVAAAALMKEYLNVKKVLVVSPASLKTEWEEQIRKFTDLSTLVLFGPREERLKAYRETQAFFILTNYEQIVRDYEDINNLLQPDLVILDEAQRIKNWKTKTASNIKKLNSKFAFILTGTPIENKIDELYSLTEFIDPRIFGSLFRFNRKYYNFDAEGKTFGFKNLRELHETIKPIMLRRRKDEIAEQLPERIDNNYFVQMTPEQLKRYEEHAYRVSILMSIAKSRPLKPEEHDDLQRRLACMRMLCDTVYILDQTITDSPKVDEVIKILNDIWDNNPERKVIIFSEWVKILELMMNQLVDNKVIFSWHVGTVPQEKRRDEINNFKNNPECKVFLSSDSGGVGLNLQAASVVINMDLPWNPAKLEQRIARAWRKHQKNSVNVINLISENTIEHRMLATLGFKRELADGILDARADFGEIEKPDNRNKFMERLASIMNTSFVEVPGQEDNKEQPLQNNEEQVPCEEKMKQELSVATPPELKICNGLIDSKTGALKGLFAVSNNPETKEKLNDIAKKSNISSDEGVLLINEETYALLQKLSSMGIISFNSSNLSEIYKTKETQVEEEPVWKKKKVLAASIYKKASRDYKMARLLKEGGFDEEYRKPLIDSIKSAAKALFILANESLLEKEPELIPESSIERICSVLKVDADLGFILKLCYSVNEDIASTYPGIYDLTNQIHEITEAKITGYGL
ncbi:MAG TPA: hypothetical protein DD381_14050 [Lentisphaeria bacterium]|nr:MAG: hypothetical protein A2X47_01215 [Lentisphaerae bacterium GWF2_38_69]HBM17446.1 hypothetical protein [Lentisphaeria bacterium]